MRKVRREIAWRVVATLVILMTAVLVVVVGAAPNWNLIDFARHLVVCHAFARSCESWKWLGYLLMLVAGMRLMPHAHALMLLGECIIVLGASGVVLHLLAA